VEIKRPPQWKLRMEIKRPPQWKLRDPPPVEIKDEKARDPHSGKSVKI
jgi:hypothetical protein